MGVLVAESHGLGTASDASRSPATMMIPMTSFTFVCWWVAILVRRGAVTVRADRFGAGSVSGAHGRCSSYTALGTGTKRLASMRYSRRTPRIFRRLLESPSRRGICPRTPLRDPRAFRPIWSLGGLWATNTVRPSRDFGPKSRHESAKRTAITAAERRAVRARSARRNPQVRRGLVH